MGYSCEHSTTAAAWQLAVAAAAGLSSHRMVAIAGTQTGYHSSFPVECSAFPQEGLSRISRSLAFDQTWETLSRPCKPAAIALTAVHPSHSTASRSKQNMLRRKPTRIELTTDDVQDYEAIKKKAEESRRKQEEIESKRNKTGDEQKAAAEAEAAKAAEAAKEPSRRQVVASRIGLHP